MVLIAIALQREGDNNKTPAAAKMIMAGRILNTKASCLLDSPVRWISPCKKASGLRRYSASNRVILGLFAKYNPAPIAARKMPDTNNGQIKALAIAVLPKCEKPIPAIMVMALNSHTILAEKTSALAQSVLSLTISISLV